jgi:hypothetical protein
MNKCSICGSTRVIEGPFYDRDAYTCQDCGSQFNREVRAMPTEEEVTQQVKEQIPFPTEGFSTPAEAEAHLRKLQAQAAKLLGTPVIIKQNKTSRKGPPAVPEKLIDEFPPELVMMGLHFYTRKGESNNTVIANAKAEREFRNENIRIWYHSHIFGGACFHNCREII